MLQQFNRWECWIWMQETKLPLNSLMNITSGTVVIPQEASVPNKNGLQMINKIEV